MFIKSISYTNKQTGWTLQKVYLDRFNLLVGASGVGKTQILRALRTIHRLVLKGQSQIPIFFSISFSHRDTDYEWEFESSHGEHSSENEPRTLGSSTTTIIREKLTTSSEGVLIERDQDKFLFKGQELPQLNRSSTALHLIDERPIHIINDALGNGILDDHPYKASQAIDTDDETVLMDMQDYSDWQLIVLVPPHFKAFTLQNKSPEQFSRLKSIFMEIFPSVEDLSVELTSAPDATSKITKRQLQFKLKEHKISHWVPASDISSGMIRTLIHLVDLMIAPNGSVVLIDEFENSLGVNCMGPLTDFILSRAAELQFIVTSHHPYIINKIPKTHWKVVRRLGSTVKVTPAGEVRALQGSSSQDEFTRLINSPEFEEGLA